MRTVKPRVAPVTLAELIFDLDDRSDGDEDGDVLVPAEEWRVLLDRAQVEVEQLEAAADKPKAKAPPSSNRLCMGYSGCTRRLTSAAVDRGDTLCTKCRKRKAELERGEAPPAPVDDEDDELGLSSDVSAMLAESKAGKVSRQEKHAARLADAKHQAAARKAVSTDSLTVCHGCGASVSDDTGGLSWGGKGKGTFCTQCVNTKTPAATPKPTRKRMQGESMEKDDE